MNPERLEQIERLYHAALERDPKDRGVPFNVLLTRFYLPHLAENAIPRGWQH
jgi:hypothetical protein